MNIETRQTVTEYSEAREVYGFSKDNTIEDFMAMKSDIADMINLLNDGASTFTPQFGTGSPEGVVISNYNRTYYDDTLLPASYTQWVNPAAGAITGWVVVA